MKKILTLLVSLFMVVSFCACGTSGSAKKYTAGSFQGTGAGRNGDIVVTVEFTEDAITSIKVDSHTETAGIADPAINNLPGKIVESQSLAVDAISGATMTSNGIKDAVADAVTKAGGDAEALRKAPVKEAEKGADETVDVDVVVVGGGGAGIAAASSACENGATVLLVEKTAAIGGNTLASGLAMNAADSEMQGSLAMITGQDTTLEAVLSYDESTFGEFAETLTTLKGQIKDYLAGDRSYIFDSVEWHIIQTYTGGLRTDTNGNTVHGKFEMIKTMCENSLSTWKWLGETVGIPLSDSLTSPVGSLWMRGHNFATKQSVFDCSSAYITSHNGTIMTETKAEHLIVDNGTVKGVVCTKADGGTLTVNAKSVVITTGGFGANGEMVKEYNTYWPAIPDGIMTTCVSSATGDGINLGLEAGASLVDMGLTQLMPTASALTGQLADGLLVPSQYYMFVNAEGKRFVNEAAARDTLASAALSQTGGMFYHIADQDMIPTLQNKATQEQVDAMVEKGIIYKADTVAELAAQIGCDAATLQESIDKYNAAVDAGKDEEFGKNMFGTKIQTAPYYAVIEKPAVHHTMGGLEINVEAEVLDANGNPIPGLYAAGECTGGIHAGNRLGGNAIADIMVFGKIAGANAAK